MATSFSHLDENHAFVAKSLEFHESKGAGKSWTCKLCNSPGLVFANANYVAVKHVAEECPSEAYKNKYGEPTKNGRGEILYSDVAKIGNSLDPEFWKPLLVTYRALVAKEREIDAPLDAPPLPDNTFINFGLDDGPILCSPGDEDEYTSESESGGDSPKTAIGDEDLLQTYEFPFTPPWVLNDSDQEKWRDCRYLTLRIHQILEQNRTEIVPDLKKHSALQAWNNTYGWIHKHGAREFENFDSLARIMKSRTQMLRKLVKKANKN